MKKQRISEQDARNTASIDMSKGLPEVDASDIPDWIAAYIAPGTSDLSEADADMIRQEARALPAAEVRGMTTRTNSQGQLVERYVEIVMRGVIYKVRSVQQWSEIKEI